MFIEKGNLPHSAKTVLIGEKYAVKLNKALKKLGLDPEIVPNNPFVNERLAGHADLSVLHTGGERVYLAPFLKNSALSKRLEALGGDIRYAEIAQASYYPFDVQLNLCLVGKHLFFCPKVHSPDIVDYLTNEKDMIQITSRQGYSRCSICVVDEKSIITADDSIAATAENAGFEVLKINAGSVRLAGFDYGFIGGASFKLSDRELAFTGLLDRLTEKNEILNFLSKRGIVAVFLTGEPIFDVGGIIPLTEKADI